MEISETRMKQVNETQLENLLNICVALTSRPSTSSVLRELMASLKQVTNADGGTLYLLNNDGTKLRAVLVRNDTLKIESDEDAPEVTKSLQIPLMVEGGKNLRNLAASAVNNKRLINIADRTRETGFDFSGANKFDQRFGYQSKSFLTLPLISAEGRCLGAIQLVNARNEQGEVSSFGDRDAQYAQGIASLAATALTTRNTMQDLEQLFEYFAELLALMNDHIAGSEAVAGSNALLITLALAKAMHNSSEPEFNHFKLNETVLREIKIAGWLRSWGLQQRNAGIASQGCSTSLINLISQRVEIIRRDLKIEFYESVQEGTSANEASHSLHKGLQQLDSDWQQLCASLSQKSIKRDELESFGAKYTLDLSGKNLPLISSEEALGLMQEAMSTAPVTDQPETTRAIISMLSTLKLPNYLGQALNLANLNSLLDDGTEKEPVIFDPSGQLIYSALRITEQFSKLLNAIKAESEADVGNVETQIQKVLRLLRDDSSLNQKLVELLIQQKIYQPYI